MRPDRGFSLLEVLVSITLSVGLLSVAFVAFQQVQKGAQRNEVMTHLAVEAGYLYQRISKELAGCQPGAQFGVRRIMVPSTLYSGGYASELWFLEELGSEKPGHDMDRLISTENAYRSRAVWCGWQWRPARADLNEKLGTLWMTRSSNGIREVQRTLGNGSVATLYQGVQPRVSRKRTLEDNDGRLLIQATASPLARYLGDDVDLWGEDRNLNGTLDAGEDKNGDGGLTKANLGLISTRVKRMTWQWVDIGGGTLTASAADGVLAADAGGVTIAPTGDPWWTADTRVVDGLYRDGRTLIADRSRTVLSWRPAQLRLELVLADPKTGIERPFSFTFALTLDAPIQTGL